MKYTFFLLLMFFSTSGMLFAQQQNKKSVLYEGLYVAKTGSVPAANIEIYTYLRFYDDGTVYLQTVSANDAQAVASWFGKGKKYSQAGTYSIDGARIKLQLSNKSSEDSKLEGRVETVFAGSIMPDNQICLVRDGEKEEKCFVFTKTQ